MHRVRRESEGRDGPSQDSGGVCGEGELLETSTHPLPAPNVREFALMRSPEGAGAVSADRATDGFPRLSVDESVPSVRAPAPLRQCRQG